MKDAYVLFDFWFLQDISTPSAASTFLGAIEQTLPELLPKELEVAEGLTRQFTTYTAVPAWTENQPSRLGRFQGGLRASRKKPDSELSVDWSFEDRPHFSGIGSKVANRFVEHTENVQRLVGFVERVCETMLPAFSMAMHQLEFREKKIVEHYDARRKMVVKAGAPGPPVCLTDLYWLNFFGDTYVSFFG
jgi:hypothetical protein